MNVAMEENVGQIKHFERALEGLGSEPTQGTIPPSWGRSHSLPSFTTQLGGLSIFTLSFYNV